ncbi:flavin reductase family protein [Paenactinomyces guangxiensis]|uniref:Flavin reductase family protein n=1 Tax=Paenactinomyces guangxiensis TaxID=1490290 RepID=A0A7W1WTJ7_9BACL|nr:flavin reductase family protein [Paenactinomyces guangxiensis]MBA4495734.1 flavin reductase family protein [Paenactinomyces guangxiensis]MBH8592723.1 flavin reductase family protein [Paenactinomyces guangxiensis]
MRIDPKQQTKQENYKLLIGSVLPRPIAFITSVNGYGLVNAAPFSFFNVAGTAPPLISVAVNRKPGGRMKDTARNIAEQKEFVVHVVDGENVNLVNDTSVEFPSDVSEAEAVGFHLLPSEVVKVPRIAETKIQMECRLHQMMPLGGEDGNPNTDLIIGEVVLFHIDDSLIFDGKIDTFRLDPVSRLAGTTYGKLGETFSLPRLPYDEWLAGKQRK